MVNDAASVPLKFKFKSPIMRNQPPLLETTERILGCLKKEGTSGRDQGVLWRDDELPEL